MEQEQPRPLPPVGSRCRLLYGLHKGEIVTVLYPLIVSEGVEPQQVLVLFDDGTTYAKFPYELEAEHNEI